MASIQVPPEWEKLNPSELAGTIVVIGGTDSGKSTFVRWLVGRLSEHHPRVGWLDADVGQSTLGIPTTLNLAVVSGPVPRTPHPDATFFVGATSPRGHMLPAIVGAHKLQQRAQQMDASAIVVDTTGLVDQAAGGGALKQWKIALLEPATVVAIQRYGELAHILAPLVRDRRRKVHIMSVADAVNPKSTEERVKRRQQQYRGYFADAAPLTVDYSRLPVYDLDQAKPQQLLSLQDEQGFVMGLGVIRSMSSQQMTVVTPLRNADRIAGLRVGSLQLDPETGKEFPR